MMFTKRSAFVIFIAIAASIGPTLATPISLEARGSTPPPVPHPPTPPPPKPPIVVDIKNAPQNPDQRSKIATSAASGHGIVINSMKEPPPDGTSKITLNDQLHLSKGVTDLATKHATAHFKDEEGNKIGVRHIGPNFDTIPKTGDQKGIVPHKGTKPPPNSDESGNSSGASRDGSPDGKKKKK
ncbi:hypothetical protein CPB83DRAFT_905830 [Crepidotus variabilis]|uniref:Uncharacterized protein n=1 Tax=Crepidotus variabilis TaxID=179855 RepID=A0A9P6EIV8_9AGAR|nr:hypothetical protein CPB83DRAFT_905830 [Crepidotus variabilis]